MADGAQPMTLAAPAVRFEGHADIANAVLFAPVSLRLEAGLWTCLLGGSGAGKSTILRLLAGLETGADFTGLIETEDGRALTGRVSYMAQDDLLLPWANVARNVALGAQLRGQTIDQAKVSSLLHRVQLHEHAGKLPAQLSGGQRQRVALARTLMEDKPVILLDEPFSALDAQTRADMQEMTAELLADRTVLLVTHDPAEAARLGHHIFILSAQGLARARVPQGAIPRSSDAAHVLQSQADLLNCLRKGLYDTN